MSGGAKPFTEEQEARLREIMREELTDFFGTIIEDAGRSVRRRRLFGHDARLKIGRGEELEAIEARRASAASHQDLGRDDEAP